MNIVYVLSIEKAIELQKLGFQYTTQTLDNKQIFVFIENPELLTYLNNKFSKQDYFIDKILRF